MQEQRGCSMEQRSRLHLIKKILWFLRKRASFGTAAKTARDRTEALCNCQIALPAHLVIVLAPVHSSACCSSTSSWHATRVEGRPFEGWVGCYNSNMLKQLPRSISPMRRWQNERVRVLEQKINQPASSSEGIAPVLTSATRQ
eukprot:2404385-Amphidinium_carterae.1